MSRCSRWPTSRMRKGTASQDSASSRGKVGVASCLFPASGASWQPSEICWAGAGQGTAQPVCPPGSVSSPATTPWWGCCGQPIERRCERSSRRATGVGYDGLGGEDRAAMTAAPFRMSRIGRHGVVYGAGIVLSKAAAFAMLPIYTRYLSPADYGLLQLVQMVLEVASIIAGSRLGAGIFRFYHKAETPDERRAVLSTALIVLLTSYAAAATGMYALAPYVADFAFGTRDHTMLVLVRLAAASLAFESLVLVPLAYLRVRDKSTFYVAVTTAKLVLQLTLNVAFVVHLGLAATGVLLSTLVTNIATGAFLACYLVRDVGLRFSKGAARDLLRFGVPFIGTQVATFILTFGDRYFLRSVSDTTAVGYAPQEVSIAESEYEGGHLGADKRDAEAQEVTGGALREPEAHVPHEVARQERPGRDVGDERAEQYARGRQA